MWQILLYISVCLGHVFSTNFLDQTVASRHFQNVAYRVKVEKWLKDIDTDLAAFNKLAANLTWQLSTQPDSESAAKAKNVAVVRNRWKNKVCSTNIDKEIITEEQKRKMFLLCRGPKFSDQQLLEYLDIAGKMSQEYNSQICLTGSPVNKTGKDLPKTGDCLYGEPDLERLMKRTDLAADQLQWIWLNWHNAIGPKIKPLFQLSVQSQNEAARANGYTDMGQIWREELEIDDLEKMVFDLYREIEPIYLLLHAVVRDKLYKKYGPEEIDPKGPIPVHLLGNMWGQDWSSLIDFFHVTDQNIDLQGRLMKKTANVKELVLSSEDFYTSLNLRKMTKKFWSNSIFEEEQNATLCHGTAANLYNKDDFRMLMCGTATMEDFYVIHHEMGHIEYYMAYGEQPAVFQDGTNTAFHESIGDAIMHGVMTPQHLHRLNLITDTQLLDSKTELYLIFLQALSKLPEIPFSLIIDKFRWEVFRGNIPQHEWNNYYWNLSRTFRGIVATGDRGDFFDPAAKFHIPDNTPYIRYFLSSLIQMQFFKSLCQVALYGNHYVEEGYLPLQRCDIYGSKTAGKKLFEMMEKGASVHWKQALNILCNTTEISAKPLLEYYKPVFDWLKNYVTSNAVYVGW